MIVASFRYLKCDTSHPVCGGCADHFVEGNASYRSEHLTQQCTLVFDRQCEPPFMPHLLSFRGVFNPRSIGGLQGLVSSLFKWMRLPSSPTSLLFQVTIRRARGWTTRRGQCSGLQRSASADSSGGGEKRQCTVAVDVAA